MKKEIEKSLQLQNEQLEKKLEQKATSLKQLKRDLKIEASLEKVRAVAMSMRKSEEVITVCEAMYKELTVLGFTNIRNAQIAINNDTKQSYTISVYSDADVLVMQEAPYKSSPVVEELYKELGKSKDAFYKREFSGEKFEDWRRWRESLSALTDEREKAATSLCFYLYSIGEGHLGISTYNPVTEEQEEIIKRFKNVFELSYQRYTDVAKAEAQAREAQIELALERVRARTMAMQHSEELAETSFVLFQQFKELGKTSDQISIGIFKEDENVMELYSTLYGSQWKEAVKIDLSEPVVIKKIHTAWKKKKHSLVIDLEGDQLKKYNSYRKKLSNLEYKEKRWVIHIAFFSKGVLTFSTIEPHLKETIQLLERFATVFDGTYTRFLDLQKAEAQSRESQIQLALERTRTQSMIMQHSNELDDTLRVFHEQVLHLNIPSGFSFLWLPDEHKDRHIFWAVWAENNSTVFKSKAINYPLDRNEPATAQCLIDWKGNEPVVSYHVPPAGVENYFDAWSELIAGVEQLKPEYFSDGLYYVEAFMKYGCFGVMVKSELNENEKKILDRFAVEFERTYTRFVDLQKAEAQSRESQIQLALERVRARTMAMQQSDELPDAANILFQQVQTLGMPAWSAGYCIWDDDHQAITLWMSSAGIIQKPFRAPVTEDPSFIHFYDAWKRGETFYVEEIGDNAIISHYQYMLQLPVVGEMLKQFMADGRSLPTFQIFHLAFFSQGFLLFITYEPVPEAYDIFKRFGNVFDQTYTRFLDLQKAEAQTRESKIELGLERVRARAMAMQTSNELSDLVDTVFKELTKLDFEISMCIINIIDESTLSNMVWGANPETGKPPESYFMKFEDYPFHDAMMKGYKERAAKYIYVIEGDEKKDYDEYLFNETEFRKMPPEAQAASRAMKRYVASFSFSNFGGLQTVGAEPLSKDNLDILARFGKVFDLTYTRFNDLQKAEAQARESQIQLALERVRARTMAMQRSDELKYAATLLFQQAKALGVPAYSCGYNIWEKGENEFTSWMSTQDGSDINGVPNIPLTEDVNFIRYVEAKQNGEPFFVLELRGERMQEHYEYLKTIPAFKGYFDYAVSVGFDLPQTQIHHVANFSQGNLLFITLDPCPEFHDVFKRFAAVFEQTYTRFLDLQKAEAQARESQIELALERVRARTMAMQKSEELSETAFILYQQFKELDKDPVQITIGTMNENERVIELWLTKDGKQMNRIFKASVDEPIVTNKIYVAWKEQKKSLIIDISGQQLKEYNNFRNSLSDIEFNNDNIEDRRVINIAFFSKGLISVSYTEPAPTETVQLLERFAGVFDLTYTRFLDLKKAEAQSRESQIELALERVRARTMAMQKSEELKEVIQVVYDQFVHLNINVEHTGFIMDYKARDDMHIWLADQHEVPTEVTIPYFDSPHWNSFNEAKATGKDFFANLLSFEEKNKFYQDLFKLFPVPDEAKEYYFACPGLAGSTVLLDNISLYIENFSGIPYTDEENNTLMRFGKVFQQTYTRFLDLQKAEAQTREAHIEAALEKVRGRSLAMHKSDEIIEVARAVFEKLNDLTIEVNTAFIIIFKEGSRDSEWWLINRDDQQYARIFVKYTDLITFKDQFEAKEQGKELFSATYHSEEKKELFRYLFTQTDFKYAPPERQKFIFESEAISVSMAMTNKIAIQITRHNENAFSQEDNEILKRFSKVFDQSYTRFLDLQKAEAQARESQIEAALEKVRSRSLAMHKSVELQEVVNEVFERLRSLDIDMNVASIFIFKEGSKDWEQWVASSDTNYSTHFHLPYTDNAIFRDLEDAKKEGKDFYSVRYSFAQKNEWFNYAFENTEYSRIPNDRKKFLVESEFYQVSFALLKNTGLQLAKYSGENFSEKDNDILKRFSKIFEQAYTRFLDLQKSEAQAREAQIEASLERVRSKTMAMHSSNDVGDTVATMFNEFVRLGIQTNRCGILIFSDEPAAEVWTAKSSPDGKANLIIGKLDLTVHGLLRGINKSWKNKETFYTYTMEGNDLKNYYQALNDLEYYPTKFDMETLPLKEFHSDFYFSEGSVFAFTAEPIPDEASRVIKRFAAVFGQTYRRYLDLQKAEAQAREAQIESALERVRSRTMAMQNSHELAELVATVFTELNRLEFALTSCIIWINNPELLTAEMWVASTEMNKPPEPYYIKPFRHPYFKSVIDAFKEKNKKWVYEMNGEEKNVFQQQFFNEVGSFPTLIKKALEAPESVVYSASFYNFGALEIVGTEHITDEKFEILHRLGKVFDMSYTRFNDLKQAEAQAKEARIEAALERVRSRTMAMQKSDELAETAAVLFRQLIDLGIAPNRLYIGIINDDTGDIEAWATDEDGGKVNSRFTLSSSRNASIKKMYDGWKLQEKSITIDMDGKELADYIAYISGEIHVPVTVGHTQQRRVQNIAYFGKGLIGIASPDPQPHETVQLIERFAAVFNLTYTRFNDLKVAEAHAIQAEEDLIKLQTEKKRAEDALNELQVTQRQLIQSEKMASLGELTAGIAHEIQNPLNFVNNFSEVNTELIKELKDELIKGNLDEISVIANDIESNSEKINHHGKRADAIVKGMLQHSRSSTGVKESTNINALADEYLRLSYHGMRAKDKEFNAEIKTDFDETIDKINIIPQDIGRVLLNLFNNAFYAVNEKAKQKAIGYEPTISVSTKKIDNKVVLTVKDNGIGIPQKIVDKIFQPFFTTKPAGVGTGLGLSLSYDIIKAHGGEIKVKTKEGEGSEFIISMPVS